MAAAAQQVSSMVLSHGPPVSGALVMLAAVQMQRAQGRGLVGVVAPLCSIAVTPFTESSGTCRGTSPAKGQHIVESCADMRVASMHLLSRLHCLRLLGHLAVVRSGGCAHPQGGQTIM